MSAQIMESRTSLWPAAHDEDADRPRSRQRQLGASDTVCERRAAYILAGTERTDESDKKTAILGTYAHEGLLGAARRRYGWLVETSVGDDQIRGHIDAVHLDAATAVRLPKRLRPTEPADVVTVEDVKTKSTYVWDRTVRYGATEAELRQVYLYAHLLRTVGWEDRWGQRPLARLGPVDVQRIRFRFVNRDNGEEHVQEFAYDPEEAARARWWVERVTELPGPEDATRSFDGPGLDAICDHCPFRTTCWGLGVSPGAPVQTILIHNDADRAQALADYVAGHEMETKGKALKRKVRKMLDASPAGVYGPNELSWTGGNERTDEVVDRQAMLDRFSVLGVEPPERTEPDWEAMERLLIAAGLAVPMRTERRTTARAIKVSPAKNR
ncbi:PD-(D/E)XK nuclease family protein [Streptomyces sp. NPDC056638]|uniref:PD-(D/E)XK nuclease family protein n=1 Tax=Streptomyces sp. NPDC056638 TaxID=3345887 RepID=UPI0036C35461